MKVDNRIVKFIIIGFLFLLAFLFAISISGGGGVVSFWKGVGAQVLFLVISYLIYNSADYQSTAIGINVKTIWKSIFYGIGIGMIYIFITRIVPGFSIAVPLLPNSISNDLRFFIVVILAPVVESVFFLGALLAYIRKFNPSKKGVLIAIVIQAVIFALFHLGAYISGLYDLPSYSAGFLAFSKNISVFISAFVFGLLSGFLVYWKKIQSLLIAIVIHLIINLSTSLGTIQKAIIG
jgi:membrane protease YdiL (CAAX protease family)